MMNIFQSMKIYVGRWSVSSKRAFTKCEIDQVDSAIVVASQYGNSVCFTMKSGGQIYIPLSHESSLGIGDPVDISKAQLFTLSRAGADDIYRVYI